MKAAIMSDTHGRHEEIVMPQADLLIHSGDFSHGEESALAFVEWYSSHEARHKILVAGNHDLWVEEIGKEEFKRICEPYGITYLEDESVIIEGIKFYGSPWTPLYRNWAFMAEEEELAGHWDKIETDTEVLITHGPQLGVLDKVMRSYMPEHLGSRSLERKIQELKKLKYHFFGHVHGESGIKEADEYRNYTSCNAAALYEYNQPRPGVKHPVEIEL